MELRRQIAQASIPPIDIATIQARLARKKIMEHWQAGGAADSKLGLPVDSGFPVLESGGGYLCEFRGGRVHISGDNGALTEDLSGQVIVTFEGFGLEMRQEDGDEIFGSVNCQIGTTGYKQDFVVPEQNLGPKGNNRIAQLGIVLYEGPPVNLNILLTLVEHDSGDRAKVRDEVKKRFNQIFNEARSAAGAAAGAPSEAMAASKDESESSDSLQGWLIDSAAGFINDLFGMGDDPYNPVGFTISHGEMSNPPSLRTYRCSSDPKSLEFNFSRISTCRDDADDIGQISALFSARPL